MDERTKKVLDYVNAVFHRGGGYQRPVGYEVDLRAEVLRLLVSSLAETDTNWCSATISWQDDVKVAEEVPLNSETVSAWLNGPRDGDVDICNVLLQEVHPAILDAALQRHKGKLDISNPNHRIELLDGRTMISFENCSDGYVTNVDANQQAFEVISMGCLGIWTEGDDAENCAYTRGQLEDELTWDEHAMQGQAISVDYFPFRRGEVVFHTGEDLLRYRREKRRRADAEGRLLIIGE